MIQETAFKFWKLISALTYNSELKFNNEWFNKFKKYYNIKKYKQHDEIIFIDHINLKEKMIDL